VLPDVLTRELDAAWHQVAELAELANGLDETGAEAVDVGAALHRGNQVDVTLGHVFAAFRQPCHRPVDGFLVSLHAAGERIGGQQCGALGCLAQVVGETVLVVPLIAAVAFATRGVVDELHAQAGAQYRLGAQHMDEAADGDVGRIKVLRIGQEAYGGAGVALTHLVDQFQFGLLLATREAHAIEIAAAFYLDLEHARESIDHGYTDAMQTTGETVVLVGEL